MSKFLTLVTSFAAVAKAIVLPSEGEMVRNATSFETSNAVNGNGVLHIPLARINNTKLTTRKRQSLDGLRNDISGYSIQIGVGTPPQLIEVQIDTGSSELWVNPNCANAWYPTGCTQNGFYIPTRSSTKQLSSQAFSITYGLGSVSGYYVKDNIAMGSANIIAQQFGGATTSTDMMEGIMGVGWGYGTDTSYYNVIDQLANQGITHSRTFSLDLASIDVAQGSIIFGGIDTMKYIGALEKRPIIPSSLAPDKYPRYWIYMTSLGVTAPGSSLSIPVTTLTLSQPIFPDSGSTFCYLPQGLFNGLLSFFSSAVNHGGNQYTVPCSLRNQNGTIDFGFGGTTIHVSFHEFLWFDGEYCWLAAVPSTEFYLLGDAFMRSAYIVYDQDNSNVLLAQAANCGSNIVPISTSPNAVPSVVGGCTPAKSTSSSIVAASTSISKLSSSSNVLAPTVTTKPSLSSSTVPLSSSKVSSSISVTPTSTSKSSTAVSSTTPTSTSKSASTGFSSIASSSKLSSSSSIAISAKINLTSSLTSIPSLSVKSSSTLASTSSTMNSSSSSLKSAKSSSKISSAISRSWITSSSSSGVCKATTVTVTATSMSTTQAHGTCTVVGQTF